MKKLFPILFSVVFLFLHIYPCFSKSVYVAKGLPLHTIREGIDACRDGDTLIVAKGIYNEVNIVVTKSIYLKGIGLPVVDGGNKYGVFTIQAHDATIDGFKVQHAGRSETEDLAGIMLINCYRVKVINNVLDDTNFGIYLQHSNNCRIENNRIKAYGTNEVQSGNGIHGWRSDSLIIIGNTVSGHRDGLYFEFVTNSVIWRNVSAKNVRYGIHFMFSHHDTYVANVFEENESGVAVMFTHHIQMYNNFFIGNWGAAAYGILLKEISDSYISGNRFSGNTTAINMEGCTRIRFERNNFQGNGWALKISASCADNDFTANNFIGNTFDVATNGTLVLNSFNGNYWDKYEGYDLNKDNVGDVPYHPVSMYSMVIESNPAALMLFRSLIVSLLDKSEKVLPGITPENLKDETPLMKPIRS